MIKSRWWWVFIHKKSGVILWIYIFRKSNYEFSDTSFQSLLVVIWFWFWFGWIQIRSTVQFLKRNWPEFDPFYVLNNVSYWFETSSKSCKCCISDKILQLLKSFIFKFVFFCTLIQRLPPSCVLCIFVWQNKEIFFNIILIMKITGTILMLL